MCCYAMESGCNQPYKYWSLSQMLQLPAPLGHLAIGLPGDSGGNLTNSMATLDVGKFWPSAVPVSQTGHRCEWSFQQHCALGTTPMPFSSKRTMALTSFPAALNLSRCECAADLVAKETLIIESYSRDGQSEARPGAHQR